VIAVFAKEPRPGTVKTRLAATLGAEAAAALHARLVHRTLATATRAFPGRVELWCAPDASGAFFAECESRFGVRLRTQQGQDLGVRMAHAFEDASRRGEALVLVGSDCAALEARDLREALELLRSHDAVVAPAEDGGYALIALKAPAPALFLDIAWSGPDVMATTRERAREAGLALAEMRTLWDVDRPEDVARLEREGLA
jgi:uncharacterized protein